MDEFTNIMKDTFGTNGSFYKAGEQQKKMELIGATCVKLANELVSAMKGEPINDVPVEAFLPERKEEIL